MRQPTMNQDIEKYKDKIFIIRGKKLVPAIGVNSTEDYNHIFLNMHHFVRKSIRKNSPEFYAKVEHLQKLILMPAEMNLDLEGMSEKSFLDKWGMDKLDLVFSRLKWREGYYEVEKEKEKCLTTTKQN